MLDLRRPIYKQTAAYGHFGRTDVDLPWERTDKAEALRNKQIFNKIENGSYILTCNSLFIFRLLTL